MSTIEKLTTQKIRGLNSCSLRSFIWNPNRLSKYSSLPAYPFGFIAVADPDPNRVCLVNAYLHTARYNEFFEDPDGTVYVSSKILYTVGNDVFKDLMRVTQMLDVASLYVKDHEVRNRAWSLISQIKKQYLMKG